MSHHHKWITSVNSRCPYCGGAIELCESGYCDKYRCKKCGLLTLVYDGWHGRLVDRIDLRERLKEDK